MVTTCVELEGNKSSEKLHQVFIISIYFLTFQSLFYLFWGEYLYRAHSHLNTNKKVFKCIQWQTHGLAKGFYFRYVCTLK